MSIYKKMNKIVLLFIVIFALLNFSAKPNCFAEAKGLSDFLPKDGTIYQDANGQNYTFYYPVGPTSDTEGNTFRGTMCGNNWAKTDDTIIGIFEAKICDKTSSFSCCYDYQQDNYYTCGSDAPFCCNQETADNTLMSGCWGNFNQGCVICN